MSKTKEVQQQMMAAMKAKDTERKNALSLLLAALKAKAKESGNLYYIHYFTHGRSLPALVDVGQDFQSVPLLDVGKHLQPLFEPRSSERLD